MVQRDSYQIFDRSPISAVIIKVKQPSYCSNNSIKILHLFNYTCSKTLFDVNDFIVPATENSAVSITTRIVDIEHILERCDNTILNHTSEYSSKHQCHHRSRCILPPFYRHEPDNKKLFKKNYGLCWFKSPTRTRFNYEALDYTIFIKHFVEFPQLDLIRHNLLSDRITKDYLDTCEYDPNDHPLCPKFRILKILQMVESNSSEYEFMFYYGSLIEIKISWKCDLDRPMKYCEPIYEFVRLDVKPYEENPYHPGSTFLVSRHFFEPNTSQLHRLHTHIYNLHIVVSVTGEAGRFDLFQTTTSIGSFLGIFGTGAIVCDLFATFVTNFKRVRYER
ncbi:unnamed protein product [Adineta steineri]|uniref:ATP receptor n=1 Tax=Adineta steineri TaxID=433720 RepID=A0A813QKV4_9BILA|nr:unnamed protein product [Adineta steineri]